MARAHNTRRSALAALLSLVGLGAPGAALAQGFSADIELMRPTFSTGSLPGVDSALTDEAGTVRGGFFVQYQRDPLLLYEKGQEVGALVARRAVLQAGVSWDINRTVSLRASVPAGVQWATEVPEFTREGAVVGDLFLGGKVRLYGSRPFSLAIRGDVGVPSGTREAWMGEGGFRGIFGPTMTSRVGPVDILADINIMGRRPVETPLGYVLASELQASAGARYHVWRDRASASVAYLSRSGLGFTGQGGAENPSELVTSFQYLPHPGLQLDAGVGKGLAEGAGSTEFRAFVGLTWIHHKPEPIPPPPPAIIDDPPEVPPEPPPEPEPEPEWKEDELARIKCEQIVIRDPIEFEFNTSNILPKSLPTLQYVADLLNDNWRIAHLVVEGHASEEGSDAYNYSLSLERSRSIWEALIRAGVHPDRMSFRSMGETVPKTAGADEAALSENRRVEFKIVRQFGEDERPADYRGNVRLPWNGEPASVKTPAAPPPPEEKKPTETPKNGDLEDFFDKLEEGGDAPEGRKK